MLRLASTRLPAAFNTLTRRTLATGPASGGSVSDEMIEKLEACRRKRSSTGSVGHGLAGAHIEGARSWRRARSAPGAR